MTKRTKEILDRLDAVYTREYKCYLNHENPGQLLIATMLSLIHISGGIENEEICM